MKNAKQPHLQTFFAIAGLMVIIIAGILFLSVGEENRNVVELNYDTIEVSGTGAAVRDNVVTIMQGGSYRITGTLTDGQIYVDAGKGEEVELVLSGADISNMTAAAIYIEKAKQTTIVLEEGTENRLQSGIASENGGTEESGAVLYAKGDLIISGSGSLQIAAYINNGIQTKDNLLITGGSIEVEAVNHGVKGHDSVAVTGGDIKIAVGNKGILSDLELCVTDGNLQITESTEGMEANQVTIEGGKIQITAAEDGINANGGAAKKKKNPSGDIVEEMPNLLIKDGEIYINAQGDGLDSNGNLLIEGGTVVIDGPTEDDDGALDYGTENGGICRISGGTVLAIGSAGMAETFDEDSKQCSFCCILDKPYEAGSEITVSDSGGNVLYQHNAAKKGASVVFSAPSILVGETYILSVDGKKTEILIESVSTGL